MQETHTIKIMDPRSKKIISRKFKVLFAGFDTVTLTSRDYRLELDPNDLYSITKYNIVVFPDIDCIEWEYTRKAQ